MNEYETLSSDYIAMLVAQADNTATFGATPFGATPKPRKPRKNRAKKDPQTDLTPTT